MLSLPFGVYAGMIGEGPSDHQESGSSTHSLPGVSLSKKNPHAFYALLGITIFRSGPTKFAFFFFAEKQRAFSIFQCKCFFCFLIFHLHPSMKTLSTRQWLSKAGHGRRDDPHLSPAGQLGAAELAAKCRELHQQRQANGFTKTKALWCVYFSMETL